MEHEWILEYIKSQTYSMAGVGALKKYILKMIRAVLYSVWSNIYFQHLQLWHVSHGYFQTSLFLWTIKKFNFFFLLVIRFCRTQVHVQCLNWNHKFPHKPHQKILYFKKTCSSSDPPVSFQTQNLFILLSFLYKNQLVPELTICAKWLSTVLTTSIFSEIKINTLH